MSQYTWTTQAIENGLIIVTRYSNVTWYIAFVLSIPVFFALRNHLCGEHPPALMNEPLHAVPFLLASTASVLVCVIASSGLRCTIPTTNISFAVLKPMLPNQCTPELHRLEPDAWPCVRDGASQYIQRVVATDGWQHIQGPGLKYFLMFLSYFGPWLLIAVVHYLERYFERSTRVYRVEDEVVVAEAEELPREGTGGEKDDANPKQLPNERA